MLLVIMGPVGPEGGFPGRPSRPSRRHASTGLVGLPAAVQAGGGQIIERYRNAVGSETDVAEEGHDAVVAAKPREDELPEVEFGQGQDGAVPAEVA